MFNGSKKKLWYTIQPKEGATTWELLTPTSSMDYMNRSNTSREGKIQAKDIHLILCKKIAFLSGGKDKRGRPILTIPNVQEPLQYTEYAISTTLKYLSSVAKKSRNFAVVLDVQSSTWNAAKPIIGILQYCLRDHIGMLYIVKPKEFWEKQVANFNFKLNKDKLGFETVLVSSDKLRWYVDGTQLTEEFKGKLYYDHQQWIRNRVHYEKYMGEVEEKLDVFENFSQKAKLYDEANDSDSSSEYSDSGNVTGPTPSSSSSDTAGQQSGVYHVEHAVEFHGRQPRRGSTEHGYLVPNVERNEYHVPSSSHVAPIPAPRKKSLTSSSAGRERNEKEAELRHRSRSVPPRPAENEKPSEPASRQVRSPPPYSHVYSVPDYKIVSKKRAKSEKLPRSHSDYSAFQQSDRKERSQNGPRHLRRRHKSVYEEIGPKSKIVSSKSVPNLTKYNVQSPPLLRRNSTIVDGDNLLKDLQALSDENGFNMGRTQPLSDENFSMIQNVSNYQKILSRLEEKNMAKLDKKKSRSVERRKTVTGIPAVDDAKPDHHKPQLPSPSELQENLKNIITWFRGPGEDYFTHVTSLGASLKDVEGLIKTHTKILSNCVEKITLLSKTKSSFETIASSKLRGTRQSNLLEALPQWIISIKRNLERVEKLSSDFQNRLQRRSNVLQSSCSFYSSAKKLSGTLSIIANICKDEVTLLDGLDSIQNQMNELHFQNKKMKEFHLAARRAAEKHLQLVRPTPNERNQLSRQRFQRQTSHVRYILSQLQLGVDRCSNLAEGCKTRLQHVYQLKAAQTDVLQAVEWLCDATTAIKKEHRAFGKSAKHVEYLMDCHEKIKSTGKQHYDHGNKQLSAMSVLRRCLQLSPPQGGNQRLKRSNSVQLVSKSGKVLPSLEDAWDEFISGFEERKSRLTVAHLFYKNAEQLFKRGSQLEVDLDNAYIYCTESQILPLREAHYSFRDNWDQVMKLGDNLLKESCTSSSRSQERLDYAIHNHIQQLEDLKTSLQTKWARIKGKGSKAVSNTKPSSSNSHSWVANVSESTDWVRAKLVQYSPNVFEIGRNLKDALKLLEEHNDMLQEMREKDGVVFELLQKEEQVNVLTNESNSSTYKSASSLSTPNSQQERKMQRAMSYSLADLWKDLNSLLARRNTVLHTSVSFYTAAEDFGNQLTCLEQYLHWNQLPLDVSTTQSLLQIVEEMYNKMVSASQTCLLQGEDLTTMLKQLKPESSERHKASFGSACTAIECTLESLMERKRLLEFSYQSRKKKLEHVLKIRQWEDEVDQVGTWFEVIRLTNLESKELGVDESNTNALMCHLEQVKDQVQERLERAKKLIQRANAELKAFGNDAVKLQSRDLDELGESLMKQIEKRKSELTSALSYYQLAKECDVSLGVLGQKLSAGRFSSDPDEAEEQKQNFFDCISATTETVLNLAANVMKLRQDDEEGTEGVKKKRDEIVKKQEKLFEIIGKLSSDAARLHKTLLLFTTNCNDLKKWISDTEQDALSSTSFMPSGLEKSSQFLKWHQVLFQNVERKTNRIQSLIESANLLLETGINNPAQIKDQAEEVKEAWYGLNKKLKQRISTSEELVQFLTNVEQLSEKIDQSHALALQHSKTIDPNLSASFLTELEEQVNKIDADCLDIVEESNEINVKLKELGSDDFEVSSAVNFVTENIVRLHKKKSEFKDTWLSWRYKTGMSQETSAQIKILENNVEAVMDSCAKLNQTTFPQGVICLGNNLESNLNLLQNLRISQKSSDELRAEVEKTVKNAEMLGLRISSNESIGESPSSEEQHLRRLVKNLLGPYQTLHEKMKHFEKALLLTRDFFKASNSVRDAMMDIEYGFSDANKPMSQIRSEFHFDVKLGSLDVRKEQIDEELKNIEDKSLEIRRSLERHNFGFDETTLLNVEKVHSDLKTTYSTWLTAWKVQKEKLLNQKGLLNFYEDFEQHRKTFATAAAKLQSWKEHLSICCSRIEAEAIEDELLELSSDIEKNEQDWSNFVSFRELQMSRSSTEIDIVNQTSQNIEALLQKTERAIQSAKALQKLFKLSNEYDKWNEEIQQIVAEIRNKSESIRSSEDAEEVMKTFEESLLPQIEEQAERSKEVAAIVAQTRDESVGNHDHSDVTSDASAITDQKFHDLLQSKKVHAEESLNVLRAEAGSLNSLINGAREHLKPTPPSSVKPYDMTVLLDENLEKERLCEEMKQKLFVSTSTPPGSVTEAKPYASKDNASFTSASSTDSSEAGEYILNDHDSPPKSNENIFATSRLSGQRMTNENQFSRFSNNYYRGDTSSVSKSSPTSSIRTSQFAREKIRPSKPPRNKSGRIFWEDETDPFEIFPKDNKDTFTSSSSTDEMPAGDHDKMKFAVPFEESSPETTRCHVPEAEPSIRGNPRSPCLDSVSLVSSCDTEFLLNVKASTQFGLNKEDLQVLAKPANIEKFLKKNPHKETFDIRAKESGEINKKPCWKRTRRDLSKSNGLVPALVVKTTKTKDANRIAKPKNAFQTISIHPQCFVEERSSPKFFHGRSESYLSSSSSVWDTDCLVAADPRTTKVPSVLVRSARNELDTESDNTDDLLQCNPYSGLDLTSTSESSSDDTLVCPEDANGHKSPILHGKSYYDQSQSNIFKPVKHTQIYKKHAKVAKNIVKRHLATTVCKVLNHTKVTVAAESILRNLNKQNNKRLVECTSDTDTSDDTVVEVQNSPAGSQLDFRSFSASLTSG